MTHSPTPTELLALRTANAALLNSPDSFCDMVATVVFALGSAQLLQSPETAAELARLEQTNAAHQRGLERRAAENVALEERACALQEENAELAAHVEFRMKDIERLRARVAELETSARGCDGEGCVLPHSSWCTRAREFAAQHSGCTCGEPWKDAPQTHAGHCWLLSPPDDELEWYRKRVAELRARVAELEAERHSTNEALSDAAERLRRDRDRIAELETQVRGADDLRIRAIDKGDQLRAELDKARGAAGIAVHRINANGWQCEADATTAIGIRNEVETIRRGPVEPPHCDCYATAGRYEADGRRARPGAHDPECLTVTARPAPLEDPHDSPLHHTYLVGRDLPEVTPAECPPCGAPADSTGTRIPRHRTGCPWDAPEVTP